MSRSGQSIKVAMIAAMGRNRVIGCDNKMPWHLPEDLKYFKATTMGKPIVMGRKTFDSLGRPLPGRSNIVISRQADLSIPGVQVVDSIEQALTLARHQAELDAVDEIMIIGGAGGSIVSNSRRAGATRRRLVSSVQWCRVGATRGARGSRR